MTNLWIDQPLRRSIQRLTARAGEHNGQVGFDGVALVVVARPGLQVALVEVVENEVDLADGRLGVHSAKEGDELLARRRRR